VKTCTCLLFSLALIGLVAADAANSAPFQMRLVQERPGTNTTPMTITHLIEDQSLSTEEIFHVENNPLLDHTAIAAARVKIHPVTAQPEIVITFSDEGQKLFAEVTRQNLGKRLGIVIDGRLLSAPIIRVPLPGGNASISGGFSEAEAAAFAKKINLAVQAPEADEFQTEEIDPLASPDERSGESEELETATSPDPAARLSAEASWDMVEGRFDDALKKMQQAVAIRSDVAEYHVGCGMAAARLGKMKLAAEHYASAEAIFAPQAEKDPNGVLSHAFVAALMGSPEKATMILSTGIQRFPDSDLLKRVGASADSIFNDSEFQLMTIKKNE
jgi:hypothetical protein